MRLFITALACLISVSACGQKEFQPYSQTYKESNYGISLFDSYLAPGCSMLFGKRKFYSEKMFFDMQVGLAFPTLATGKIGVGKYNFKKETSSSFGLRIWPAHIYIQHSGAKHKISEKRENRFNLLKARGLMLRANAIYGEWNFSIEAGGGYTRIGLASALSSAIITVGYRIYYNRDITIPKPNFAERKASRSGLRAERKATRSGLRLDKKQKKLAKLEQSKILRDAIDNKTLRAAIDKWRWEGSKGPMPTRESLFDAGDK